MTLAAPRSRQGKLLLVLAFLAAVAAVVGAFLWANQAHADLPSTSLTYQSVTRNSGRPVAPGRTVTYTITPGDHSGPTQAVPWISPRPSTLTCSNTTVTCCDSGPVAVVWTASRRRHGTLVLHIDWCERRSVNVETMTVTGQVPGRIADPDGHSVHDGAGATIVGTGDSSVGAGPSARASRLRMRRTSPGVAHTFAFNLAAGCDLRERRSLTTSRSSTASPAT